MFFAAAAVAGYTVRWDRHRRASELGERQDASTARARHARLRLVNERLRIADELSAVITGSIHTIARHAEIGSQLMATDPDKARDALQAMSEISRNALNDLRRLLKHMRTATEPVTYTLAVATADPIAANTVGVAP
ncbi:MAG: histidine kinase [Acidimicrobiales bacterium]